MAAIAVMRPIRPFHIRDGQNRTILRKPKLIAILATPSVQLLDVAGPLDVFAEANAQAGWEVYTLRVFGCAPGAIRSSSGVKILADQVVGDRLGEQIDTLLIAGAPNCAGIPADERITAWLHRTIPGFRRYGSVCSGAFILARAGLLDGRRVTTHWAVADRLAEVFPKIRVEMDAIYIRDGRLRTAAGVTAGLDLAVALVEEDLGREIALKVAGQLVMFFKRPGGQAQFSRKGETAPTGRAAFQELQRWIAAHPAENHRVATLAKRLELSPRHFARLFRKEVGITPADWVTNARVAAARRLLESAKIAPKEVASECGFADADSLRRAFVRVVGISPAAYRKGFANVST
jgi:transcriptional regulator GlxA family with amidase domain